ncbi:MAG TPA: RNA 2',3'-cyclic phosphodiesterase [Allosphingosinicella sp.]|jgi:2'-5' RNA ligase
MHRLFVAIRPPRPVREQLLTLKGGVADVRWQTEDQIHITVRFIGEVDRHIGADIAAALGSVRHPAFEIALSGIGTFGKRGQPGILWAGLTPHNRLKALHKKVDHACIRSGLEPEGRAYRPHITLARLKRGAGSIEDVVERCAGLASAPFQVDNFGLFESSLTPEGAVYTMVERYSLA